MVRAALRPWDDMVDGQVPRLEMRLASCAVALLLVVQPGLVLQVVVARDRRLGRCVEARICAR